jgi:hypothetical protein
MELKLGLVPVPVQAPTLIVINLTHPQAISHRPGLGDQHTRRKLLPPST